MKLTEMSTRYLILLQVFSIANAFAAPVWFQFYNNTGCRQSAIDTIMLQMVEDHLSEACVSIYDDGMHKVGGLAISNPNPCVVGVYGDKDCEGEMIAYAMHWNGEPSCFNLTGSKGSYYASASCLAPTKSASQTPTLTSDGTIYLSVGP
jgi:hypothetical protein